MENTTIINEFKKRFNKFLEENVKEDVFDFDAYLDELITQFYNTGHCEYELSKLESKSKNPELFSYELEEIQSLGYGINDEN